jgi:hypothetical protein
MGEDVLRRLVEHYFPSAIQIMEWIHPCQYLDPVAELLIEPEDQQIIWIADMKNLFWEAELKAINQTCKSLLESDGLPAQTTPN